MDIPWTTLASTYETLLEKKKEVDSRVLPQDWAYQEALKKIEMRRKEKELQEENKDAKKDGILGNANASCAVSCDSTNLRNKK